MSIEKKQPDQLVKSLDRALQILEKLIKSDDGCSLTELSQSLGLHKSTVYRLLATLVYRGYVQQDENTKKYKVGLKLFELGSLVLDKVKLRSKVKPFLREIMKKTKETVHLGILNNGEIVYIDKVESPETIRMYSHLGARVPLHCTSLGKAILAYLPEEKIQELLPQQELKSYTSNTITGKSELIKHLEEVQENGFAVDDEEFDHGIRCIGAPIFNHQGKPIAAFSISGPTMRMTREKVNNLKVLAKEYSLLISNSLGFQQ